MNVQEEMVLKGLTLGQWVLRKEIPDKRHSQLHADIRHKKDGKITYSGTIK